MPPRDKPLGCVALIQFMWLPVTLLVTLITLSWIVYHLL